MLNARPFIRDWSHTPLHWVPDDILATHVLNVLHLVLPSGELWMCRTFNKALPLIRDEQLKQDVQGMVRQEGAHASSHRAVLGWYERNGFDFSLSHRRLEHIFTVLLSDRPLGCLTLRGKWIQRWLLLRLGVVAAIEHLTCALGSWAFYNETLEKDGADSGMVELIKWHGAEEIEHRCVALELYRHLGGGYCQRTILFLLVFGAMVLTWMRGARAFLRQDAAALPCYGLRGYRESARRGHLPSVSFILRACMRYFRPGFHPESEASTQDAQSYLARFE
ncbi:MAG: metal-dependent hydrolase [Pseudomonadota bacterium]